MEIYAEEKKETPILGFKGKFSEARLNQMLSNLCITKSKHYLTELSV